MITFLKIVFCYILLTLTFKVSGQENIATGARASALGNSAVTLSDEYSIANNIAGIASTSKDVAGISAENRFGLKGLTTGAAFILIPTKYGVPGLSFNRFGDKYYNEQLLSLGFAHKIRMVSLGVKISYYQVSIEESGIRRNLILDFGGIAEVVPDLFFGAFITNINQAKSGISDDQLPVIMKSGIGYKPSKQVYLSIEVEKNIYYPLLTKVGIEYSIGEKLFLRTGINLNPIQNAFGIGFKHHSFKMDYAFGYFNKLGVVHQFSFSQQLNFLKKKLKNEAG